MYSGIFILFFFGINSSIKQSMSQSWNNSSPFFTVCFRENHVLIYIFVFNSMLQLFEGKCLPCELSCVDAVLKKLYSFSLATLHK